MPDILFYIKVFYFIKSEIKDLFGNFLFFLLTIFYLSAKESEVGANAWGGSRAKNHLFITNKSPINWQFSKK